MKPSVIYIDEEPRALKVNGRALQKCFGDQAIVYSIEPIMLKERMIELIFSYTNLSSIIIDQKLKAAGTADYYGTELASSIRELDKKIPVYILTNFSQELDSYDSNVEYILSKDDLVSVEKTEAIATRLRRHLNIFQDIMSEREERFELLLRKSRSQALTDEEIKEYENLGFYREKKILASELIDSEELQRKLDLIETKLSDVKNRLGIR